MKSQDIIRLESENDHHIYLFLEGKFWRAYERSAYAICNWIRPFSPIKREQKVLNGGSIVMIGFPESTLDSVLHGQTTLTLGPKQIVLSSPNLINSDDFENWKDGLDIFCSTKKAKSHNRLPESHEQAPSYKVAWEILSKLYTDPCIRSVPREYKFSLLAQAREDMIVIVSNIYKACYVKDTDKISIIDGAISHLFPLRVRIRIMYETAIFPEKFYLKICPLLEALSSQLSIWRIAVFERNVNSQSRPESRQPHMLGSEPLFDYFSDTPFIKNAR